MKQRMPHITINFPLLHSDQALK